MNWHYCLLITWIKIPSALTEIEWEPNLSLKPALKFRSP